jgi:class 3 adenylate cyclase
MTDSKAPTTLVKLDGTRLRLEESFSIGRGDQNDYPLSDQLASRKHAVIQRQNGDEFWLVDYGSRNGTYLNGRRIAQPVRLANGDLVVIGETEFRFDQARSEVDLRAAQAGDMTVFNVRPSRTWLLVADVIGSSQLLNQSNLSDVPVIMGNWLAHCKEAIEGHGGRINQFMGDGFFAYWPDEAGIEDELLTALTRLKELQTLLKPDFRMILHLGDVVLGGLAIGEEERISGGEVNFSFRMEKLAGKLQINRLASQPVQARLGDRLAFREQGRHSVAGFDGEFVFYSFE